MSFTKFRLHIMEKAEKPQPAKKSKNNTAVKIALGTAVTAIGAGAIYALANSGNDKKKENDEVCHGYHLIIKYWFSVVL